MRNHPAKSIILIAMLLLLPAMLRAATPEEVANSFFAKLRVGDHEGMCELFHPSAVKDVAGLINLLLEDEEESAESLSQFFGEEATREAVAKMSDMEKFKGFMGTALKLMGEVKFTKFKLLGTVAEGETQRHVVMRMTIKMEDFEMEGVDVATLKKHGDSWGLLMKAEMAAIVEGIRRSLKEE